jgi:hypothetical protein
VGQIYYGEGMDELLTETDELEVSLVRTVDLYLNKLN